MNEFEKGGLQHQAHGEFFQLCRKYWNLTEKQWKNDQFWDDLIAETDKFCDKYCTSEDRFWVHPITALIDRIEDQARGKLPLCEIWDGSMQLIRALVNRRRENDGKEEEKSGEASAKKTEAEGTGEDRP